MRFSLIYEAQTVEVSREADHRVFHEILEQVDLAEELGFDVIWASSTPRSTSTPT